MIGGRGKRTRPVNWYAMKQKILRPEGIFGGIPKKQQEQSILVGR